MVENSPPRPDSGFFGFSSAIIVTGLAHGDRLHIAGDVVERRTPSGAAVTNPAGVIVLVEKM